MKKILLLTVTVFLLSCGKEKKVVPPMTAECGIVDSIQYDSNSFAYYLKHLSIRATHQVRLYDGTIVNHPFISGIVQEDFGTKSNEQCADAVIFLRAKYLWEQKRYSEIKFHFVNGFLAEYEKWAEGYRVNANNNGWVKTDNIDYSYETFRKYLDKVFDYANTASLYKELESVLDWEDNLQLGDLFIVPGFPGHTAMVVDIRRDERGHQEFRLAQGFMPAQQIEILNDWYKFQESVCALQTSRYFFFNDDKCIVKRWKE